MTVLQCDLCGVTMELGATIIVGKRWRGTELCMTCAQPILEFLTDNELLEKAGLKDLHAQSEAV